MPVKRPDSAIASFGRTFGGLGLLTIGFMCTLGTILGFFGRKWWAFDTLANYRLQYGIALIAVGILYGMIFTRSSSVIFLAAGVLNLGLVAPFFIGSPAEPESDEALKIMSFDVASSVSNRNDILRYIDQSEADIVFLLNTSDAWIGVIRSAAIDYELEAAIPGDLFAGTTVLSKEPVTVEVIRVGRIRDLLVRVETQLGDQDVAVYAVHARSATSEPRTAQRDEMLAELAIRVAAESTPTIVVGDLNASPWSYAFSDLKKTGDLVDSMEGHGFQASWPTSLWVWLRVPIDHMLHTSDLTVVNRALGPDLGSRHSPLIVTVGLAAPG